MEDNIITEKKSAMSTMELPLDKILHTKWTKAGLQGCMKLPIYNLALKGVRKSGNEKSCCLTCEQVYPSNVI